MMVPLATATDRARFGGKASQLGAEIASGNQRVVSVLS